MLFKIFIHIIQELIKISCLLNLPLLTAALLILGCRKNNKIKYDIKSKKKIIYLYKSIGIKDLEKSFKEKPSENPIFLCSRSLFITIFVFFVGNKVEDFNYTNVGSKNDKKKYRDYLVKTLTHMIRIWNIGGFISSSIFYRADKELEKATEYLSLLFITIHKESVRSDGERLIANWVMSSRIPKFNGSKLIVYTQGEKKSFAKSGFCEKNKIEVCGCPRFDDFIKMKKFKHDNKSITFFVIQNDYGLPTKNGRWYIPNFLKKKINCEEFDWSYLSNIYKKMIINFIENNPDFNIFIKAKPNTPGLIKEIDTSKYKNVKIISGGDSLALIEKSKFVVVFNSTVEFEAIAANRILISLKDLVKEKRKQKFILNTSNLELPSSTLNNINKIKIKPYKINKKEKLLLKYMGNIDGKSSLRVANALNKHFKKV